MKITLFAVLLLTYGSFTHGYSNESPTYGIQNFQNKTLDSISVNGAVNIEQSTVSGEVQIKGALRARESSLGSLHIQGGVSLTDCTIFNKSWIDGVLIAEKTTFKGDISIATEKVTFTNCNLSSLTVRKALGLGKQIIELNKTTVNGNIVVEAGEGEIWLSSDSTISGKVTGATVIKK